MKYLMSCLKIYRKEAILAPLFKLLEATLELIVPLIVRNIIDVGIANEDTGYIVSMVLVLVAFGAVGLAFSLTAQYFAAKAAVGTSAELRKKLFSKLQSLSFSEIDEMGTATMIARMTSDVNQVQTGVNMGLRLFLRSPFIVFGAMAMAFVVDAPSALVFVGVIPVLAVVVFTVMAVTIPLYRKVQAKLDKVLLSTKENLSGVRVVRAFGNEKEEETEFNERNGALLSSQKGVGRISALTGPLTYIVLNVAVILLVYVGALRVENGAIEQGSVVALYSLLSQILVELIKLANLIVTMTKAVSSEKRIATVLDKEGEPSTLMERGQREGDVDEIVRFENVTFSYHSNGAPALSDVSFGVKRGQTVGVIGGTGSGKSTLVSLLPRFYTATEGRVFFCGEDVRGVPKEELRSKISVAQQKATLVRGTIKDNLLWGNPSATDSELLSAVKIAQAEDVVKAKGGLMGEVAQGGRNLSGGQRQRLSIARALVKKPEVLILDDSSSALDYATDLKLRKALSALDTTVFILSQRTVSVQSADIILVLDDGKLVGKGTHRELVENCPVYAEIYRSQFKEERYE